MGEKRMMKTLTAVSASLVGVYVTGNATGDGFEYLHKFVFLLLQERYAESLEISGKGRQGNDADAGGGQQT